MVSAGDPVLCFDARLLTEYREVLRRPRFGFEESRVDALLEQVVGRGTRVAPPPWPRTLPDPDDAPFLEAAKAGEAECLVTGNLAHFPKAACLGVRVLSPAKFIATLGSAPKPGR